MLVIDGIVFIMISGWIEQGGLVNSTQYNNTAVNVTFLKEMKNTNYYASATPNTPEHQVLWQIACRCAVKSTTGMSVHGGNNADGAYTNLASWEVKGFVK